MGASALAVSFSSRVLGSTEPAIEWDTLFDLQSFAGAAELLFVAVVFGPAAETLLIAVAFLLGICQLAR